MVISYQLTSLWLVQGGPMGVLPGHVADDLQRAGAPPRSYEGATLMQSCCDQAEHCGSCTPHTCVAFLRESPVASCPMSVRRPQPL